jgi:Leucine-rich repeat (LRR) protein
MGNQLTNLCLSWQPDLISLVCSQNQLNSLDLSNNTELKNLFANDNQLTNLEFLDQLKSPEKLKRLDVSNNKFSSTPLTYFQFFPNLKKLLIANNPFYGAEEDIENLKKLEMVNFENTKVKMILVSKVEVSISRDK